MSEQFTLPPGCQGLKIDSDGHRYAADRRGHIEVSNPDHAAQIREKGSKFIHKAALAFNSAVVDRCACGFAPHSFSSTCPRCRRPLK